MGFASSFPTPPNRAYRPVRLTVWGLLPALSRIFRLPVTVAVELGWKRTPIEQLAPAASVLPVVHVVALDEKWVGNVNPLMTKTALLVDGFVTVTVLVLVLPTETKPKLSEVGEIVGDDGVGVGVGVGVAVRVGVGVAVAVGVGVAVAVGVGVAVAVGVGVAVAVGVGVAVAVGVGVAVAVGVGVAVAVGVGVAFGVPAD
jgi:hypothetical protein